MNVILGKQLIFVTFPDFPCSAEKYEIHPPKLCVSTLRTDNFKHNSGTFLAHLQASLFNGECLREHRCKEHTRRQAKIVRGKSPLVVASLVLSSQIELEIFYGR